MKNLPLNVVAHFGFQFHGLPCNRTRGSYIKPTDAPGKKTHKPNTKIQNQEMPLQKLEKDLEEIWWVRKYLLLGFCFVLFSLVICLI